MKKNRMMRLASILMIAVLMTTCTISGTFAKYVTEVSSQDHARVAKWGFEPVAMDLTNLFSKSYDLTTGGAPDGVYEVASSTETDVIAPGTWGQASFAFAYDEASAGGIAAPEVAYTFKVDTTGSGIGNQIKGNASIQWKLDENAWGTWDEMIADIQALDGKDGEEGKTYLPGSLPAGFTTADDTHTVYWQWIFENGTDEYDTTMGNMDVLNEVTLKITITATQVD